MVAQRDIGSLWSVEQYLEMEHQSSIKHELIDGRVYAMSGGNQRHSRIGINVTAALADRLVGQACQVFNSDMKVLLSDDSTFLYPDATITCDQRDLADDTAVFIRYPCVVAEILSASTAKFDQGAKFDLYRSNPTLREYILVSAREPRVEVRSLNAETQTWTAVFFGLGEDIVLPSLGMRLPVALVYRGLTYPQPR